MGQTGRHIGVPCDAGVPATVAANHMKLSKYVTPCSVIRLKEWNKRVKRVSFRVRRSVWF